MLMMTSESSNAEQKQIYLKAYQHLPELESALKAIKEEVPTGFQISILGKVVQFYRDKDLKTSTDTDTIKTYWETTLNKTIAFGSLYNPEIGDVFIVGALASTFLYELNGKTLGMLSVGPYGILRGIGGSAAQVTAHLKMLKDDNYLLIIRGIKKELENYKRILEENYSG